ncbi:hypothetical protein RM863_35435 [Streptomyces sp. DSM 41014]|uniref:Uncharacterized protein n=1 Tax=Streptomyces hintoniae TaxID=3075521 RepID=A0ABU2UWN1_9ACTN|nr:hypothetical protein [Streptomyces sp. DSM 41014]MDT0477429.1 hypothetical protein [Streptomyces sp. DSM 41014]
MDEFQLGVVWVKVDIGPGPIMVFDVNEAAGRDATGQILVVDG